jgi:hypothetical protein
MPTSDAADWVTSIALACMVSAALQTTSALELFALNAHGNKTADRLAAAKKLSVRSLAAPPSIE